MIHPDSELRFINPAMGYGLFAVKKIPRGTITWVSDPLDQIVLAEKLSALPGFLSDLALKYSYINGRGERVLCWDNGRFVNHSCAATCLSPGFDFEIATRDIGAGEEITDDYGTLNLSEAFTCLCGAPNCRGSVQADDPDRYAGQWDALTAKAFPEIPRVAQPLWELVREKASVESALRGEIEVPSVLHHYRRRPLSHSER